MKFSNALIGVLFLSGLSACAPTPVKFENVVDLNWQQQQLLHQQLQSWVINGRISIQTEYDGGQADFTWQQHNLTDYNIRLIAPMGAGTTLIKGRADGVSLTTSSGDEMHDTNVDKLMQRLNGWRLPVSGLQYWVRGLPAPSSAFEITQWKESGFPEVMLQDGWRIEFKKYKAYGNYHLAGKLFINRQKADEEVDVRVIIRHWSIGGELNTDFKKVRAQ